MGYLAVSSFRLVNRHTKPEPPICMFSWTLVTIGILHCETYFYVHVIVSNLLCSPYMTTTVTIHVCMLYHRRYYCTGNITEILTHAQQGVVTAICPMLTSATAIKVFDHEISVLIT